MTNTITVTAQVVNLTTSELQRLTILEQTVSKGLQTFVEVGKAIAEIRDSKLYRENYSSFEDYLGNRWGISRTRGYELIGASQVVADLSAIAETVPLPENEAQARPLTGLKKPEERQKAWTKAVQDSDGTPTAEAVRTAVDAVKEEACENPSWDISTTIRTSLEIEEYKVFCTIKRTTRGYWFSFTGNTVPFVSGGLKEFVESKDKTKFDKIKHKHPDPINWAECYVLDLWEGYQEYQRLQSLGFVAGCEIRVKKTGEVVRIAEVTLDGRIRVNGLSITFYPADHVELVEQEPDPLPAFGEGDRVSNVDDSRRGTISQIHKSGTKGKVTWTDLTEEWVRLDSLKLVQPNPKRIAPPQTEPEDKPRNRAEELLLEKGFEFCGYESEEDLHFEEGENIDDWVIGFYLYHSPAIIQAWNRESERCWTKEPLPNEAEETLKEIKLLIARSPYDSPGQIALPLDPSNEIKVDDIVKVRIDAKVPDKMNWTLCRTALVGWKGPESATLTFNVNGEKKYWIECPLEFLERSDEPLEEIPAIEEPPKEPTPRELKNEVERLQNQLEAIKLDRDKLLKTEQKFVELKRTSNTQKRKIEKLQEDLEFYQRENRELRQALNLVQPPPSKASINSSTVHS